MIYSVAVHVQVFHHRIAFPGRCYEGLKCLVGRIPAWLHLDVV